MKQINADFLQFQLFSHFHHLEKTLRYGNDITSMNWVRHIDVYLCTGQITGKLNYNLVARSARASSSTDLHQRSRGGNRMGRRKPVGLGRKGAEDRVTVGTSPIHGDSP